MDNWRSTVWADQAAKNYSEALGLSDYIETVTPHVLQGKETGYRSMLDIGAGDGRFADAITHDAARVDAVEPSSLMRSLLRERLQTRSLRVWDASWNDYPVIDDYEIGFAANIGAFKSAPTQLFKKMRRHCETLVWVVPAQNGPSTFCLSGLVTHWLPRDNTDPVFHSVLQKLGDANAPSSTNVQSWVYRQRFADANTATDFLLQQLSSSGTVIGANKVRDFVEENGTFDTDGGVVLEAQKRSAILRWN